MSEKKTAVNLSQTQRSFLEKIVRRSKSPQRLVQRAQIILALDDGKSIRQVARQLSISKRTVQKWSNRWRASQIELLEIEQAEDVKQNEYFKLIIKIFDDAPRSGAPPTFSAEQIVQIVSIACEVVDDSERPTSRWTYREIAQEAIKRNIVESISTASIGRFFKRSPNKTSQKHVLVKHKRKRSG